jgi:hypothetical protein
MRSLLGWIVVAILVAGCGKVTFGPFYPHAPVKYCSADPQCPDHSACRYPAASSKQAMCMPGRESDVYAWSPSGE